MTHVLTCNLLCLTLKVFVIFFMECPLAVKKKNTWKQEGKYDRKILITVSTCCWQKYPAGGCPPGQKQCPGCLPWFPGLLQWRVFHRRCPEWNDQQKVSRILILLQKKHGFTVNACLNGCICGSDYHSMLFLSCLIFFTTHIVIVM